MDVGKSAPDAVNSAVKFLTDVFTRLLELGKEAKLRVGCFFDLASEM